MEIRYAMQAVTKKESLSGYINIRQNRFPEKNKGHFIIIKRVNSLRRHNNYNHTRTYQESPRIHEAKPDKIEGRNKIIQQ